MDRMTDHLIKGYSIFCHMEDIYNKYNKLEDDPGANVIFNGTSVEGGAEGLERKMDEVFIDMTSTVAYLINAAKELSTVATTDDEKASVQDVVICIEKMRQTYVNEFELDK